MPGTGTNNELYDVILIYSGVGYAAICPGITGAVSQGVDQQDALAMIADAMAMGRMYPLPGEDEPARQSELREIGKAKIAELVAECERDGWEYEVHQVDAAADKPAGASGVTGCRHILRELSRREVVRLLRRLGFNESEGGLFPKLLP